MAYIIIIVSILCKYYEKEENQADTNTVCTITHQFLAISPTFGTSDTAGTYTVPSLDSRRIPPDQYLSVPSYKNTD